ncbi:MAG: YicC/YloC family endoribonuclease [bacterium]|nr:YicC/YloC family endoribonuclease [bacterium]
MIQSMTGFGRAAVNGTGYLVQAELSSLNNRYLEVGLKLPRTLLSYQHPLRELLKQAISRGKLSLYMSVTRTAAAQIRVEVDEGLARAYRDAARQLSERLQVPDNLGSRELLGLDGVLASNEGSGENEELWAVAREALAQSLAAFQETRRREGAALHEDFIQRLARIEALFAGVAQAWERNRPEIRRQLQERLARLLEGSELRPERFEMEVALMLDKQDISEEITRFRSHVDLFRQTLASGQPAGSKLGFILQELVREANTVSSKSPDTTITHLVVQIKEEVERIREQVQNVE